MSDRAARAAGMKRELAAQARWRPRPRFARLQTFNRLLRNEFLSPRAQAAAQASALASVLRFAAEQVPYYRDLCAARGLGPDNLRTPAELAKLPLLDKVALRQHAARLRPATLPRGEKIFGVFKSSGTTGHPTQVVHSAASNVMFSYLTQRAYRWYRLDPAKTIANLRTAFDLPRKPGGESYGNNEPCRLARWRYVGTFFETGPWLGLTLTSPVEAQLAWLREVRPAYLVASSSWLEYLTYAAGGRSPVEDLEAAIGVVEQVTPSMRERLERVLGVPLNQGYGLNEIGLVAARCHAGRYHVHREHCLVEIVDPEGQPCAPGVPGRIAVTALRNLAMPLIRYDTDDQAEWPADPCPCGRTLPAFVNLLGRYRRYVALPDGAYDLYRAVRKVIDEAPDELVRDLRQFQMHLYRDGRFELRLATVAALPPAFHARVGAAWAAATGGRRETLQFREVDEIPRGPNGKFQDFTSDYLPPPST